MCELFAASAGHTHNIKTYLKTFYSHSTHHPHGWGLALFDPKSTLIKKGKESACNSPYLAEKLKTDVDTQTCLAHIRYATIGNIEYANCHPYQKKDNCGRCYTLVHNGTIFDYPPLNKYLHCQIGDTDSERVLLYLVDCINQKQKQINKPLDDRERFELLDSLITDMAKGNKLNLIIYDGEYMYVHTNYKDSLYYLEKDGATLFSTTKLSDEEWFKVPFMALIAYKNGKRVFAGKPHNNEYIPNTDNEKHLYQIFSGL